MEQGSAWDGQLVRCIDLYELNVDNMNRLIIDPIGHGSSVGFLTTDVLVILHTGCFTFYVVNPTKQMNNGTKLRNIIINAGKV
ncbi:unnamed protein product [Adineta steineri]|uniref:Uncharacterized protein n=1 Tax=Adineta steineri TaxID=433720 RepID=A0A813RR10_9BILA|nr:unnamed protein product [Adineta steineri]